jgi:hypothetical protein
MAFRGLILENARRSRRTLYLITGAYVVIGFCVAIPAALSGDGLSAFLGFLIISGSLAAAAVLSRVARLGLYLTCLGQSVKEMRDRMNLLEAAPGRAAGTTREPSGVQLWDLADVGSGEPSELVAATLNRDRFPRLLDAMEEAPLPSAGSLSPSPGVEAAVAGTAAGLTAEDDAPLGRGGPVTVKDLMRQWRIGMRNADLASCREVLAALLDTADEATVASLRSELDQLADRIERGLRLSFREHLARRDYVGMLEVGERICRDFPNQPVANEFRRIKGALLRRCLATLPDPTAEPPPETGRETPSLRVVY